MAKSKLAAIKGEALGAGLFTALETHYWKGTVLVSAGDTVEAGHPMLEGRDNLFAPFAPTFPASGPQPLPAAEIPAQAEPDADVPRGTDEGDPAAPGPDPE